MYMANQQTSSYWLQANEDETHRLAIQHCYFTAALGGLIPESIPVHEIHTVLDVGCGPGSWAFDLVRKYPHMSVLGIDTSTAAIAEASRYAQINGLHAASF